MSFCPAHTMLKKRVVIDGGRRDLFIRPAVKNSHSGRFDSTTQARLIAEVITHPGGDTGEWLRHLVHVASLCLGFRRFLFLEQKFLTIITVSLIKKKPLPDSGSWQRVLKGSRL